MANKCGYFSLYILKYGYISEYAAVFRGIHGN